MGGEFNVVRDVFSDGSRAYNVVGFAPDGKHQIKFGCIDIFQANELATLLRSVAWVEVNNA